MTPNYPLWWNQAEEEIHEIGIQRVKYKTVGC